jgi:hypothetical protein
MRRFRTLGLTAMTLFAFGAFTASALAVETEEENNPRILCLTTKCSELEGTLKGGASFLEDLNGKSLGATGAEAKLKNCENLAGEKDIALCKDVPLTFTGLKKEKVSCRSENAKGEKDPVETILVLLDLHIAAEKSTTGVLQPLLLAKFLGTALEEQVTSNCGGVKTSLKGILACLLLPGLTNIPVTGEVEVRCEVNTTTHDPVTGTCNVLCENFGKIGLTSTLDGKTEVDSWLNITLKGKLNKDIFIDD